MFLKFGITSSTSIAQVTTFYIHSTLTKSTLNKRKVFTECWTVFYLKTYVQMYRIY